MERRAKIDTIVIHCTATPEGREVSRRELDGWHKAARFEPYINPETGAYTYAGYHILVHLDGSYEVLRPDDQRGQHCPQENMNNRGLAISYVGGCDKDMKPKDTRTAAQKRTLMELCKEKRALYPNARIIGHHDVKGVKKACPSFDAKTEYALI